MEIGWQWLGQVDMTQLYTFRLRCDLKIFLIVIEKMNIVTKEQKMKLSRLKVNKPNESVSVLR